MVNFSSSSSLLLVIVLVCISGKAMVPSVGACSVSVVGGGCPDVKACGLTCTPCYQGAGRVTASCRATEGSDYANECVCEFCEGAPCPPPESSGCPKPPAGATILN